MSNIAYVNVSIERFRQKWSGLKVYASMEGVEIESLSRFLKHKYPNAKIGKETVPLIGMDYAKGGEQAESSACFVGLLNVTNIPGLKIHAEVHLLPISWERKMLTLLAVNEETNVDTLLEDVRQYNRSLNFDSKTIYVVSEGPIPRPKYTWDDLIIPEKKRTMLRGHIDSFFKTKATYGKMKLPYKRGMLFVGPPGNGKSLAAKVIASDPTIEFFVLPLKNSTEDRHVNAAFREAAGRNKPSVLLMEDLDRFTESATSMSYLLNLLDGMKCYSGLLIIATANDPQKIDRALLHRPSRFDMIWHFDLPRKDMRLKMLQKLNANYDKFSPAALEQVANETKGFSMAYVQEIITSAMLSSVYQKRDTTDADLFESLANVKEQMKYASKFSDLKEDSELSAGIQGFGGNEGSPCSD